VSFQSHSITIPSYAGIHLQQELAGEGSKRLMVLLPGLGYFVDAPLMYYLREIAWQHGDDVLSLKYGFQAAQSEYEPEHQGAITVESQQAIEAALAHGGYEELFLVGKSLGTPLAAIFANHFAQAKKAILLTPIQNSHKLIEKTDTLAIIGTGDSRYSPELVQDSLLIKWQVYEQLTHSLEMPNNYQASLRVLGEIMGVCESFLYG
jgi:pimeloyl-ACP methyl ester carboxylesterase